MNKFKYLPVDIFGCFMFKTSEGRHREFVRLVKSLQDLKLPIYVEYFADCNRLCQYGLLSSRAASYILTGRASTSDYMRFESFLEFIREYESIFGCFTQLNLVSLWQKKHGAVVSTFASPLAELASKLDFPSFEEELSLLSDCDLTELKNI